MMKKNKKLVLSLALLSLIIITIFGVILYLDNNVKEDNDLISLNEAKQNFQKDILKLKEGQYDNLIYHDFKSDIEDITGLYELEIIKDTSYKTNTFLENFKIMKEVIDKFFKDDDFDRSYLVVDFMISDDEVENVYYNDIEKVCDDEKYNKPRMEFLFGNNTSKGGYMVQIAEGVQHTWFSKYGLETIHPSLLDYKKYYPYYGGVRQIDDVDIRFKDKTVKLSEMEKNVLNYLNNEFPQPKTDKIRLGIGDVRIIQNGEYEAACFKARRIYKGVYFEYGSNAADGMYIDRLISDRGEITYVESSSPDTLMTFSRLNGEIIEKKEITKIISLDSALAALSSNLGENSVYDVYGVELVYRSLAMSDEELMETDGKYTPRWKILTKNQNDDKFTIFYVDVLTKEISERFEYYFE